MKKLATGIFIVCSSPFFAQNCVISAGNDVAFCAGQQATLQATGLANYQWSPAAGLSCTACPSPVASPVTTTTYVVTGTQTVSLAVNGDFSQGNTGFGSSYQYNNVSLWNEGTYWVGNNPNTVHPNWTFYGDHTTGTGNYLIVNGAGTPGVDVWCQTVNIPPNTNFSFSCWGLNLSNPPADLQFTINGVPQGNIFTLSQTLGVWTQYAATWNSGNTTTVTICIQNMNTSVGGNDFGLDDIAFSYVCSDTDSVVVTVNPLPTANFSVSNNIGCDEICPVITDLSVAQGQIVSWDWDLGNGNNSVVQNPSPCYTVPGFYDLSLIVVDDAGCRDTILLNDTVTLYAPPVAAFTASSYETTIAFPTISFTDQSINAIQWIWDLGDGNNSSDQHPVHTYAAPGTYPVCLQVAGPMGCRDTVCNEIVINDQWTVYTPNSFTPNGDGLNEVFFVYGENIVSMRLRIFDRWGMLLYETQSISDGWNGKFRDQLCPEDVYVFQLWLKGNDDSEKMTTGSVTLIR